jgi:hypothetical protein
MGLAPSTQILLQELEQEEFLLGPVNGILGGLPVAEQTQDYFLVFKGVGGTGPEIIDNTAYFIQYVVDSDGNIFKPSQGSIARLNVLQNFPTGRLATVRIDNASGINTQLDGDHIVTNIGVQQPILYTQYGIPSSSYNSSMSFLIPGTAPLEAYNIVGSYLGSMVKTNFAFPTTDTQAVSLYNSVVSSPQLSYATYSLAGKYIVNPANLGDLESITFTINLQITNPSGNSQGSTVYLLGESGLSTSGLISLGTFDIPVGGTLNQTYNLTRNASQLTSFPSYSVYLLSAPLSCSYLQFNISSQNPSPDLLVETPFWFTGSHSNITWLTASSQLSENYNNQLVTPSNGGVLGFSPIDTPFNISPGDKIRFEYNPQKDFTIYEVIEPNSSPDGRLKIKLNTIIPSNTILDNFVLHRVNNSILKYIILDVPKDPIIDNPENPFTGLILPKYPSEKLKNNLENIVLKLKEAGVIQN